MSDPLPVADRSPAPTAEPAPDRIDLEVFDHAVTLLLPPDEDAEQRARLRATWSRCTATPGRGAADGGAGDPLLCDLSGSGHLLREEEGSVRLGDLATTLVTTRAMEASLGELLLLHAAGLATSGGRVLALCAPPGTGKTTATRLLARSFGYVTDETVAVRPETGEVLPYPKPLQIIDPGSGSRKAAVGPDALGLRPLPEGRRLRLGPVIVLDRERDATHPIEPVLEPLPLIQALPLVVGQTSSLDLLERPLQTLCRLMDAHGGPWRLRYSEAATLPALLRRWVDRDELSLFPAERWTPAAEQVDAEDRPDGSPVPAPTCDERPPDADTRRVRRRSVADAVRIPGGIGVLREGQFFLLQGIGASLWDLLAQPRTLSDLTEALVRAHGDVEDAAELTERAVAQLVARGILSASGNSQVPVTSACS